MTKVEPLDCRDDAPLGYNEEAKLGGLGLSNGEPDMRLSGQNQPNCSSQPNPPRSEITKSQSSERTRRDPRNGQIRYVRLFIPDLLGDTYRLTNSELGAYMRLYGAACQAQECLIDDPKFIANIVLTSPQKWIKIREALLAAGVIEIIDGLLYDRRARKAIDEFQLASKRNRANVANRYGVLDGLKDADP